MSTDKHGTQCDFAKSLNVEFPMIGDSDKRIAKAYDVLWPIIGLDRRITNVIDDDGIICGAFNYELIPHKHVDDAIALIRTLAAKRKS